MEDESEMQELNFACYERMFVSFTESIKREIPDGSMVIIKLGNGEIVGTRTIGKFSGAYKSTNVYTSSFHVFLNKDILHKIATNGVRKVRLAYDKKKLDWLTDETKSKMLALQVFRSDSSAFT